MQKQPVIYLLSGLGADERIFQFLHINAERIVPIKWIEPLHDETIPEYALRISKQIDTSSPVILMGVSFGGIMSIELNKILKVDKTFIISSVKTHSEFPFYFSWFHRTGIYKLVSVKMAMKTMPLVRFVFGISKKREFEVIVSMLKDSDNKLVQWTIREVLKWQNDVIPNNMVHIHGTNDHIFPIKFVKNTIQIKGGTHIMVMDRADEISGIVNAHL